MYAAEMILDRCPAAPSGMFFTESTPSPLTAMDPCWVAPSANSSQPQQPASAEEVVQSSPEEALHFNLEMVGSVSKRKAVLIRDNEICRSRQ